MYILTEITVWRLKIVPQYTSIYVSVHHCAKYSTGLLSCGVTLFVGRAFNVYFGTLFLAYCIHVLNAVKNTYLFLGLYILSVVFSIFLCSLTAQSCFWFWLTQGTIWQHGSVLSTDWFVLGRRFSFAYRLNPFEFRVQFWAMSELFWAGRSLLGTD